MTRCFSILLFTFLGAAVIGCAEKMDEDEVYQIGITACQRQPAFVGTTGLNASRSGFSTSEQRIKGLALVEFPANNAGTAKSKIWQHPSWTKFGYMGSITTDENGNVYTVPVPVINVLDNPVKKQNIVYKVFSLSGEMKALVDLSTDIKPGNTNPFGLLGIFYDCHGKKLYASTVSGSTKESEQGIIYAVDPADGKITDKLIGNDALALCVGGFTGEKRLYFGSSRTSDVFSVELTKEGKFKGHLKKEFTLDLLGPRGDDKARRIRFDKNGDMMIYGVEFNYNLTAPTEKQETVYRFRYDETEKKWYFVE